MSVELPHLPDFAGEAVLEATGSREPRELESLVGVSHEHQDFPTASGDRITETRLGEIREAVVDVARMHGFPDKKLSRTAGFDRDCAETLHRELSITVHTAASRGAWTFLTCVLLIDVAVWRFPSRNPGRFLGDPNRNTFRRLWMRREILGPPVGNDDPLWSLEDALVQVMERPGVAESKDLVKGIAEVYRQEWGDRPGPEREHLMRNFMLRVMRRQALTRLECVSDARRREILEEIAAETFEVFRVGGRIQAVSEPANGHKSDAPTLADIEDVPLDELARAVFDANLGIKVGYAPRELDMRLLDNGITPAKRHRKTVELIVQEFRDEGQVIRSGTPGRDESWISGPTASGTVEPRVTKSISEIRQLASALGLHKKEDRSILAREIGVEEPVPKYLRRIMNSAISSASP